VPSVVIVEKPLRERAGLSRAQACSTPLYHPGMTPAVRDVAQIRLDNAMLLFEEFVQATVKHPDAATLRGLERRFAERLQIQPSYWSQIKGRSRQIGERLARQFEVLCHKPPGWMDQPRGPGAPSAAPQAEEPPHNVPQDDDERFIVGLVLTYYRRHPQRARSRLLDLLGEVLAPAPPASAPAPPRPPAPPRDEGADLWARSQTGVAPLKKKR
jgi:hypothetical protein